MGCMLLLARKKKKKVNCFNFSHLDSDLGGSPTQRGREGISRAPEGLVLYDPSRVACKVSVLSGEGRVQSQTNKHNGS
jgi:hypothetical protein